MRRLVSNYLYNVSYQLLLIMLPIVTLPYVSRTLHATGVGTNAWSYSINYYFVLFATVGLTVYGQREIAIVRDDYERLRKTFWNIEFGSIIMTSISFFAYITMILFVPNMPHRTYLLIYSLSILAVGLDVSWLFSGLEKFKVLSIRNFIVKIISVVLIFTLVKSSDDLWLYVLIQSSSIFFSNASLWPIVWKEMPFVRPETNMVKQSIIGSFGLFLPQIAITLYSILNKILLGIFATSSSVGLFDTSDKIVRLMFSVFTAASAVIMPRIANIGNGVDGIDKVKAILTKVFRYSVIVSFLLMAVLLGTSSFLINYALGSSFRQMTLTYELTILLLIPLTMANIFGNQILVPLKRTKEYTVSVIFGATINLIIQVPIIIFYKSVGAAVAVLVAEITVMIVQAFLVKDVLNLKNELVQNWPVVVSGFLLLLVAKYLNSMDINVVIRLVVLVMIIILYAGWLLKRELEYVINWCRRKRI